MKLHRFFIEGGFEKDGISLKDKGLAHQLKNVLRVSKETSVIFFDATGSEYEVVIKDVRNGVITYEFSGLRKKEEDSLPKVHLFASVIKRENFEWIAQKATECGVSSITPIRAERTVKLAVKEERLKKIMKEAAEQSGRTRIPDLFPMRDFSDVLTDVFHGISVLCDESGDLYSPAIARGKDVRIYIGPEGGWTEKEIAYARENDVRVCTIGKFTLRAETAAIVATYLFVNDWKKNGDTDKKR